MKVGILAGGMGTRLVEETEVKPKPMVEIGGMPIMWHIMMHYSHFGFKDFVIALGYRGEVIKKYMVDYCSLNSNLTVDLKNGEVITHDGESEDWTVELVDTGIKTQTGGRLHHLLDFHRSHGKLATMTAVRPPARFGHIEFNGDNVVEFTEKPQTAAGWINGAFFVLEPGVFDYVDGDRTQWEKEPMERLAAAGELMAYRHEGFWQCMDTLRDKRSLEKLWESGSAPWRIQD
jgi:glucose-1-phosphate cytidylyltransferase